jgi:hypothetical protein
MATRHYGWAWQQQVRPAVKLVLLYLVERADRSGTCWSKGKTIAEATGIGRTTVYEALATLEHRGLITRRHRHRSDGTRASDEITLVLVPESGTGLVPAGEHPVPAGEHLVPESGTQYSLTYPLTDTGATEDDIKKVRAGIHRITGKHVTDDWAARVIRHTLNGHQPHNIAAYVLAAVQNNPANFLPTPTPPRA